MPEQVLDVEFACIVFDRPRSKRVTETVRVRLRYAGLLAQSAQHLLQTIGSQGDAFLQLTVWLGGEEEWIVARAAQSEVGLNRVSASIGEGHDALLVALTEAHQQSLRVDVKISQIELNDFGAAQARVEEHEHERSVADADGLIAALRQKLPHFLG